MNKTWKKLLFFLFFAYLLLSLVISFTFSINELFNFDNLGSNRINPGIYLIKRNNTIDWIAEDTTAVLKANGNLSFALRSGFLRILLFLSIPVTALYIFKKNMRYMESRKTSNIKNITPLKLRI